MLGWGGHSIVARQRALRVLPNPDLSSVEQSVAEKIRDVQNHVRSNPLSARRWGRLGMNYDVHGLATEAFTSYQQAASLDPRSFHWTYFTAIAQHQQRSADTPISYERAGELRPDYVPVWIRMGQSLLDRNRLPEARRAFERAIALDSNFSSHAYLGLAQVAVAESDVGTARTLLLLGLERNPSHHDIYALLSEVYRRLDNVELAQRASSMARQLPLVAPLEDSVYASVTREGTGSFWSLTRGRAFNAVKNYEAAIRELTAAVEHRPTAATYADLGEALYSVGKFDDAVDHFRHALNLDSTHVAALTNLGTAFIERDRNADGHELLARARAAAPDSAFPYLQLATLYATRERWAAAIDELRAGRARFPDHYHLMSRLALLLATVPKEDLRNGPEAVRLARMASALRSDRDAEALAVLAAAYAEAGNREATLNAFHEARRLAAVSRRPALARQIDTRLRQFESRPAGGT